MTQKRSYRVDPYEISPSGDSFFADSRNVKAVEEDIAKAHQPGAKFTRLENKEDITEFINSLYEQYRMIYEIHDTEVYVAVISLRSHYG